MEWQPIETAPKDGSNILLWEGSSTTPFIGYWFPGENHLKARWTANSEHYDTDGNACVIDRISSEYVTHWMPLPKPPEE